MNKLPFHGATVESKNSFPTAFLNEANFTSVGFAFSGSAENGTIESFSLSYTGDAPATTPTEESLAITSFTAIGGSVWEAGTDALLGTILPLAPPMTSGWTDLGPFDLVESIIENRNESWWVTSMR